MVNFQQFRVHVSISLNMYNVSMWTDKPHSGSIRCKKQRKKGVAITLQRRYVKALKATIDKVSTWD